jgi:hypothetical protein
MFNYTLYYCIDMYPHVLINQIDTNEVQQHIYFT